LAYHRFKFGPMIPTKEHNRLLREKGTHLP
jgi:hypothetical protein